MDLGTSCSELLRSPFVCSNRVIFVSVPLVYSGTEGRSCWFVVIGLSLLRFRRNKFRLHPPNAFGVGSPHLQSHVWLCPQTYPITTVSMGRAATPHKYTLLLLFLWVGWLCQQTYPITTVYEGGDFLIGGNMGGFQKKAVIL
jgi:hypothetical protein